MKKNILKLITYSFLLLTSITLLTFTIISSIKSNRRDIVIEETPSWLIDDFYNESLSKRINQSIDEKEEQAYDEDHLSENVGLHLGVTHMLLENTKYGEAYGYFDETFINNDPMDSNVYNSLDELINSDAYLNFQNEKELSKIVFNSINENLEIEEINTINDSIIISNQLKITNDLKAKDFKITNSILLLKDYSELFNNSYENIIIDNSIIMIENSSYLVDEKFQNLQITDSIISGRLDGNYDNNYYWDKSNNSIKSCYGNVLNTYYDQGILILPDMP